MTPAQVINMAHEAGLSIWADGERLTFQPVARLTPGLRAVLVQHKPALLAHLRQADNAPVRWCWPAVQRPDAPMNPGEVETFAARVLLFVRRGLTARQADTLAAKLGRRDRESDTRRACLECQHLTRARTCTAWKQAGIGSANLPGDLLGQLQHCPAFAPAITDKRENP